MLRNKPAGSRSIGILIATLILGCSNLPSAHAGPAAGSHDETLMHDGVARHYRIHIPQGLHPDQSVPLVLMLHGRGGNGKGFEQLTGMSEKADKQNFLVVYPDALGKPSAWTTGFNDTIHNGDDVGFLKALINKMENTYKVNPHRIYCGGFSSGAMMSEVVGGALSDKVAAIGVVEGCIGTIQNGQTHMAPDPSHPVSVIQFHGREDERVPYNGGPNPNLPNGQVLPVAKSIEFWVQHDGCNSTPNTKTLDNGNTVRDDYPGGQGKTEVVLFSLAHGKHQWPTQALVGISATDHLWMFFEAHPKQ